MDHWHNLKVVNKQLTCMKGRMKPGEKIARDEYICVYMCTVQEARAWQYKLLQLLSFCAFNIDIVFMKLLNLSLDACPIILGVACAIGKASKDRHASFDEVIACKLTKPPSHPGAQYCCISQLSNIVTSISSQISSCLLPSPFIWKPVVNQST